MIHYLLHQLPTLELLGQYLLMLPSQLPCSQSLLLPQCACLLTQLSKPSLQLLLRTVLPVSFMRVHSPLKRFEHPVKSTLGVKVLLLDLVGQLPLLLQLILELLGLVNLCVVLYLTLDPLNIPLKPKTLLASLGH